MLKDISVQDSIEALKALRGWTKTFPKGPCTYIVYTWALKGFPYSSFRAQVGTWTLRDWPQNMSLTLSNLPQKSPKPYTV